MKGYIKDTMYMGIGGMTGGMMASAVGKVGGNAGGLTSMASMMPAMGVIAGVKPVIGMASEMMPRRRRRRS